MNLKLILLTCYISTTIVLAESKKSDTACSSHTAFNKARSVLTNALISDAKGKQKNEALQKQFQNAKPSKRSANDLGVCSQYAGQNSCCNINMAKLIDQAALLKVKPIQQAKSVFQKFIRIYITQLYKNCPATAVPSPAITHENIIINKNLKIFQVNRATQASCKINFGKAISSFTRGAFCSICAGVDKLSDYFNAQGQLKISQDSVNVFQKATDEAINCHAQLFSQTSIEQMVNELNSAYIKDGDKCGDSVVSKMKSIFANHKVTNDDGKGGKICKGVIVFGDNSACENTLQGDPTLEQKSGRFLNFDDENINRLLEATPDAVIDQSGISIYTTSSTDDQIDESGNAISPNFEGIKTNSSISLIAGILVWLLFLLI
ncbi:hypothetical protein TTHERM_01029890 (macronuclear) [Tetrahymena thermophila SB210]|uniref:Transmembrane protein n=1 Tax=Tetrahymena thermophila (strain SB210) TaxID=312017 RepID=Q23EF0_TETTS|nr:hypothetical protein TTHERM_01029890 [Tetrahymena thermophila SB210]EAR94907.1 hypothetical protein TTHERM_01029890 [Tetrahymena thermophila SB210]|eukprot:XP_001015152.1 hypothetical protein TTHERM_01029890 [Tetrahymena thermophila SB210]